MTSQSAKQFRRENLILFSDSENESDDSDDEFETQDLYDCESESDTETVAVKDLKFEKIEKKRKNLVDRLDYEELTTIFRKLKKSPKTFFLAKKNYSILLTGINCGKKYVWGQMEQLKN